MNGKEQSVAMGFTRQSFPAGTHMCFLYSDEAERRRVIGKFLESGIVAREKVSYFADIMKPEEVRAWLLDMGVAPPETDGFSILSAEKTYCPDGTFIPERMLDTLRAFYEQSKKDGYSNARVSGEMSWALKGIPGSERLMEYEALINEISVAYPVTPICQYDVNKFSGAAILNVLKVHPMMIINGQIAHNPYYMQPRDFLKDYQAAK